MADRTTQRPAAILRFSIRLEDDSDGAEDVPTEFAPFVGKSQGLAQNLARLEEDLAVARAAGDTRTASARLKDVRKVERQLGADKSGTTLDPAAGGDFFSISDLVVVPTEVSLELNGFRTADKLTASFPFANLPLTSRIIRSCLVEAYFGTVPATAFANPADWQLPFDKTHIMFRGYVDEWKTEHSEGAAEVRIEARSMEAILIDQKVNKAAPIFQVGRFEQEDAVTGKTTVVVAKNELLTHYLKRFFSTLPNVNGALGGDPIDVKFDPRGVEPTIDRKLFIQALQTAKSLNQANGAVPGQPPPPIAQDPAAQPEPGTGEGAGVARVPQPHPVAETSAWDIVTIACELCGCIPVYDPAVDPDAIVVRLPQTVYDDAAQSSAPSDGFSRRLTDPGTHQSVTTPFRLLVWGRNVKELSTSRKLGRIKAPAVEVVSYNPDAPAAKRVLRARFPPDTRATRIGSRGGGKVDEVVTQVVRGIRDPAQLTQVAVGLYHSRARHETSLKITTDSMTSYQDPNLPFDEEPDVLHLRPGAAVKVLVASYGADPEQGLNLTPLADAFGQDEAQIRNFLADQFARRSKAGPDPGHDQAMQEAASRIAAAARIQKARNLYYVRTVNHKMDRERGWSAEMEVVTFARVTSDPARLSQAAKTTNDARKLPARGKPTDTQVANARAAKAAGKAPL